MDEREWNIEPFGQVRPERFHPKCFGGVMAAEQKVNPKLLGGDSGPMRRFARNEGVDLFSSNAMNLRASAAGNDADRVRLLRAEVERLHGAGQRSAQFADELFSWQRSARFQANKLPFLFKKWRCRS